MSIVEDHGEERLSTESLVKIVTEYIPNELLRSTDFRKLETAVLKYVEDDGEQFLQDLLDISDRQLRMYGSGRELAENLKIYRNFTRSFQYFECDISNPYSLPPKIYESLSNKKYVCKQDIFVHIQNLILENYEQLRDPLSNFMLLIFLKTQEEKLKECIEYVEYTEPEFAKFKLEIDEIAAKLSVSAKNIFPLAPKHMLNPKDYSFETLLNQFKTLLPFKWNDTKHQVIKIYLKGLCAKYNPRNEPLRYKHLFYNIGVMMEHLQNVIQKRPDWFLPNNSDEEEKLHGPIKLRLFEDNGEQFVLVLDVALNIVNHEHQLMQYITINQNGERMLDGFQTISYNRMKQIFSNQWKRIEFIRTPILRAKHRAVPVFAAEEHLILAADTLIELLRKLIFGPKVFQRAAKDEKVWNDIHRLFNHISKDFKTQSEIYFLQMDATKHFNLNCAQLFEHFAMSNKPVDVRNAKKDGFTLQNLINELKHLSLTEAFPDITDYADMVYDHVVKKCKTDCLKTTDLFDAVELCQMICAIRKIPKLSEFLHSQRACHRILNQCIVCVPPKPKLKEGSEDNYKQVRENLAKKGKADFLFDGAIVNVRAWDPTKTFEENTQCNTCDEYQSSCNKKKESPKTVPTSIEKTTKEVTESYVQKLADGESEVVRLKSQIEARKKEHESFVQDQERKRKQEMSQLNAQLLEARKEVIKLQQDKENEKKKAEDSKNAIQEATTQLTMKLADSKKKNKETQADVNKLKKEVNDIKEQLGSSTQELERLRAAGGNQETLRLQEQNALLEHQLNEKERVVDDILNGVVMRK